MQKYGKVLLFYDPHFFLILASKIGEIKTIYK